MSKQFNTLGKAIKDKGLGTVEVQTDGKIHRFELPNDKPGQTSGWYISNNCKSGIFGSWKTGSKFTWFRGNLTAEELKAERIEQNKTLHEYKKTRKEYQARAAEKAKTLLTGGKCRKPNPNHNYLANKSIKVHDNLVSIHGELIVPMVHKGEIVNYQRILPNGDKRFLTGGRIKGCWHPIGFDVTDTPENIIIVEGYATGASLYQSLEDIVVVVAFNAGNLKHVAIAIRKEFPDSKIIIAADNDCMNEINVGLTKGKEAATAIGARCMYPPDPGIPSSENVGSYFGNIDFNDYLSHGGSMDDVITKMDKEYPKTITEYSNIPDGYICNDEGVIRLDNNNESIPITRTPITVKAKSRDSQNNNWGLLIHWKDDNGNEHHGIYPRSKLHTAGKELITELLNSGVDMIRGQDLELINYLDSFNVTDYIVSANKPGWHNGSFVLPNQVINPPKGEKIVYRPASYTELAKVIISKGSIDEWKAGITNASDISIFAICASLAAPINYLVGSENGGFHFYGETSQGKTTLLQLASSVWGNGADPSRSGGEGVYLQRWNTTSNALEAKAEAFSDLPMVIDEIGEGDPREFGQIIYKIISGTGKSRANIEGNQKATKSWRVSLLSAGEVAVADFIESGGTTLKGGHSVRMVDIDLAAAPPLFTDGNAADTAKELCGTHYGHAGPLFIENNLDVANDWSAFDNDQIGQAQTPIAIRVRAKFALVAFVGIKAVQSSIVPWSEQQILDSVISAYSIWINQSNKVSDSERGIDSLKDYIQTNEARFEVPGTGEFPTSNRAGWLRNETYHFTSKAFKTACGGNNPDAVKRALRSRGLLHISGDGSVMTSVIKASKKSVKVTSVKNGILEI